MSIAPELDHTLTLSEDQGAPTILYLHGFLGSREDWTEVVELVGNRYSHLTVNLPGHGTSPHRLPASYYSMPKAAELVINLLDHYGTGQCHLAGYSMGGRLGLYLLVHYSERFASAIMESASPGLKTEEERAARRKENGLLADRLLIYSFDSFLEDWYGQPLFDSTDKGDPRFARMLARRRRQDPSSLALSLRYMGTGAQPSLWERLQDTCSPILFVAGERDAKYSALAHEMARLCPRGRTAILPGAGHNAHFERPDEFCRAVTEFLSHSE